MTFAPVSSATGGIEVSKANDTPAVGSHVGFRDLLKHQLALPVGIHWILGAAFLDTVHLRRSIDRGARRKDEVPNSVRPNILEQCDSSGDVCVEKRPGVDD